MSLLRRSQGRRGCGSDELRCRLMEEHRVDCEREIERLLLRRLRSRWTVALVCEDVQWAESDARSQG